ncbi:aldo/keto reductase [Nesterenkonia alkaliphila]|uniref:Aldo/keto reductase n=1 Tax=Nesterenkonia alkaliphila TaxID=1463631 RepID=A0A7K1UIP7_9MICC|nr:aldo/keto reductase [Nesterenkonia alkaliphila]MVT26355.1 aldo/keto reductase [Nesterenkonia alkaliphila]GFZ88581.1 oxidoreductase [Nesterenkonia alkaliphila]
MTAVPTVELNDGTTIPQLGFGVWQVPAEQAEDVVTKALQTGYRHIDTAAVYRNEEGVGAAIAASGIPRDELYVTTKLWVSDFKKGATKQALETSLAKLGLDAVDLYLIHWPAPADEKYLEAWQAMEELQAEGKTRSIGVSNFLPEHLDKVAEAGSVIPAVNQVEVHPALQQRDIQAANTKYGIATQAWSPLAQGAVFGDQPIVDAAGAHGVTVAQVIIRWHLQRGRILFPKSVTPARIEENFDVFGFELTDAELEAIDALDRGERTGMDPATFNPS